MPRRWTFGASEVSVSLAARELHTWTNYRGIDPEVAQVTSSQAVAVEDQAVIPPLSRFIATVHVVF